MATRRRKTEDHWSFHINDWLDNGTFHLHEEDMNPEEIPESQEEIPEIPRHESTNQFKNTGRFDQFNDEFDGNFNMHSYDTGAQQVKTGETEQVPAQGKATDEYVDEDPYKIKQNEKG
jgi:hypothetical protein